ncbi:MAG: hypothetical protein KDB23_10925, partial [Planctomycetales bacterium]|nr:hypothetical protein [Planctomycetales bacterium]
MIRFSSQVRATVGLVFVLLTVLAVTRTLGLMPNERRTLIESRVVWSQSLAVVCSYDLQADRLGELKAKLRYALERNPHVASCAVRSSQGGQALAVGPHQAIWDPLLVDNPDRQLRIPILRNGRVWGQLEVCFHSPIAMGRPTAAWGASFRELISICLMTLMGYYIYLGRTLRYLDPANAVPAHVRAALDTLAGGLLVVDCAGQIVLANRSFGNSVG